MRHRPVAPFLSALSAARDILMAHPAKTSLMSLPTPVSRSQRPCTRPASLFRRCAGLVLALTALLGARAHDWPEFRGPTGQGLSPAKDVPIRWSGSSNVAWKTAIPAAGWSSPVLVQKKVYLTGATARNAAGALDLSVLCVDAASGKLLWSTNVLSPETGSSLHRKNSYASPTPVVADGRIYAHFGHLGTVCLDLKGRVVWRQTSVTYPPMHGNGGSPVLAGDLLVFSCDGSSEPFVVALDRKTGAVRWKTRRPNDSLSRKFSFSTPLLITQAGRKELISPGAGGIYAYDPVGGKQLWQVGTGTGFSVVPRPVFAHGLLFVNTDYDFPKLFAIRPGGDGDVTSTHLAWQTGRGAPSTPSALVVGDELYFVSDAGIATCADARTGRVHWNERLGGGFSASPVVAEGRVYFQNEEGVGFVVKAGTTYELLARNELGERTLASAAVDDGALYLRGAEHLYRIGVK